MPIGRDNKWRPWQPGDAVRCLPFGKYKVGKTFGAGTFPRPCILDFDRGLGTLYSPDFMKKHGVRKFLHESFWERSFKGPIVDAHNAYDDACRYFDKMMKTPDQFDTWIVDSATTLGEDSQNKAVILLGTEDYNFQSQTQKQALKHGLLVPKIQDYGAERSLVEQFVDMVLSTDKHVVLICHEKEQNDKQGNLIAILPLLTGKSTEAVPLRFDEVFNIQLKRKGLDWLHICKTQPDGLRAVGSRNGVADETEWNYDSVLAALTVSYKERLRLTQIAEAAAAADKAAAVKTS